MTSRLDVEATELCLGDDLFGAGIITAILGAEGSVLVTVMSGRILSLAPDEEVTVFRVN